MRPLVLAAALVMCIQGGCSGADAPVSSGTGDPARPATAGRGVVGRVVSGDGSPIGGAPVTARSLDRPSPAIPEIWIVTESDGRYHWPLAPGRYELTVSADGYRPATQAVTVSAGQASVLNFRLERR